jgi:uncharacterized membrane protein
MGSNETRWCEQTKQVLNFVPSKLFVFKCGCGVLFNSLTTSVTNLVLNEALQNQGKS